MTDNKENNVSVFNLATYLTLSRFLLVPVFIYYLLNHQFKLALIVLIIAAITDVTDGLLARKFNMGTKVGSVLDPLADKFLMLVSFLVLSTMGVLPWQLAAIVIGRDFYIIFGMMYLYFIRKLKVYPAPTILSKRTTFFQFMCLAFSFITVYLSTEPLALTKLYTLFGYKFHFRLVILHTQEYLILLAGLFTLATFIQYTIIGVEVLKKNEKREPQII